MKAYKITGLNFKNMGAFYQAMLAYKPQGGKSDHRIANDTFNAVDDLFEKNVNEGGVVMSLSGLSEKGEEAEEDGLILEDAQYKCLQRAMSTAFSSGVWNASTTGPAVEADDLLEKAEKIKIRLKVKKDKESNESETTVEVEKERDEESELEVEVEKSDEMETVET